MLRKRRLLFGEVEEVDGLGFGLAVVALVLEDDAGRVVSQQELL